jgi:uncharacterized protein YlzI (FlbEa/FlbD family)
MKLIKFILTREYGGGEGSIFINPLYVESVSPSHQNNWTEIRMASGNKITVQNPTEEVKKKLDTDN